MLPSFGRNRVLSDKMTEKRDVSRVSVQPPAKKRPVKSKKKLTITFWKQMRFYSASHEDGAKRFTPSTIVIRHF
jgi:hypothetical protein